MELYQYMVSAVVSFLASVAGAICGIGGGVLIKPILDACGGMDVAVVNFLSGCTVLSMSCYSVGKARISGSCLVEGRTGTLLAAGAALGGMGGKMLFQAILFQAKDPGRVGAIQAFCLLLLTLGTFAYTVKKGQIRTFQLSGVPVCLLIGAGLGVVSAFLGIGGGPINLVVLFFFFSMDTKTAAQNSLYIILFSQAASLLQTLWTRTVLRPGSSGGHGPLRDPGRSRREEREPASHRGKGGCAAQGAHGHDHGDLSIQYVAFCICPGVKSDPTAASAGEKQQEKS